MSAWTVAFQIVNFLILAAVLRRFLFRPVRSMVLRRQGEIETATKDAESATRAAKEIQARYEGDLERLGVEREKSLGELHAEIAREREKALQGVHADAATMLEAARAGIAHERAEAVTRLADEAVALAVDLAKRLLEQVAGDDIAEILLRRACDHLESMPAEQLRLLREELKNGPSSLEVATSPPLTAEAADRWTQRIASDLDASTVVRFVSDAALIAGAELRFPHTKISFCLRDGLDAARVDLRHHADNR